METKSQDNPCGAKRLRIENWRSHEHLSVIKACQVALALEVFFSLKRNHIHLNRSFAKTSTGSPDVLMLTRTKKQTMELRQNNIYFDLFDKYFDSFAVNFTCNFTYIFGSIVYKLTSLAVRLGCL